MKPKAGVNRNSAGLIATGTSAVVFGGTGTFRVGELDGRMTGRLLALKTAEQGGTVFVRPEVVVEVAYSDVQRSPQYDCGMALRFARIVRLRDDKTPEEADTIEHVSDEFAQQVVRTPP